MALATQSCIDGDKLVIGSGILTTQVIAAFSDIKKARFSDQEDLECTRLAIDEDRWDTMSTRDRKVICAVIANIYRPYITDIDAYIETMASDGVDLEVSPDGTIIPYAEYLSGLNNTFIKTRSGMVH